MLDSPGNPDDVLGPVTQSWGISQLPENLLVDRKGIDRDRDPPRGIRCLEAFAPSP